MWLVSDLEAHPARPHILKSLRVQRPANYYVPHNFFLQEADVFWYSVLWVASKHSEGHRRLYTLGLFVHPQNHTLREKRLSLRHVSVTSHPSPWENFSQGQCCDLWYGLYIGPSLLISEWLICFYAETSLDASWFSGKWFERMTSFWKVSARADAIYIYSLIST